VEAVAPLYPDTMLLPGAEARIPAVTSRLPRAGIFHFAGHSIFDDERPGRSFLLLASAAGDSTGGRLSAAALGALDLRALDLVVLSSCETLRSPGGRSGGFAGLAGALLGAGVDGVVGSPWKVEDGLSRQLMTEFHRAYRRTGDAAASLRAAQLRAMRGPDPALREPAVWAAFRYVGN
jgi:CHAT domain-containing protein